MPPTPGWVIRLVTTSDKSPPGSCNNVAESGYLSTMAFSAFCPTCKRTVYLEDGDTVVCPVCSTPLIETVETGGEREAPKS